MAAPEFRRLIQIVEGWKHGMGAGSAKGSRVLAEHPASPASPAETAWDTFEAQQPGVAPHCDVTLSEVSPTELELQHIGVPWEHRGTGEASRAMDLLTSLADDHGVTLILYVADDPDEDFDQDALFDWYERCGFERVRHGKMVRAPWEAD